MKNIEKYRDKLLERVNVCSWYDHFNPNGNDCVQDCKSCEERFVEWLFEDSEKQVLDEKERKYLSEVIRPFRKKIIYISKVIHHGTYRQYISIATKGKDGFIECLNFPGFEYDTMYKGMKINRPYTLQELGL
jgi:hypothetical protein